MEYSKSPALSLLRGYPETRCYTVSPFATRLEAHLRLAGLSYFVEQGSERSRT